MPTEAGLTLWITARAKAARSLAIALSAPGAAVPSQGEGCYQIGNHLVTWCGGALLEMANPEIYNAAWKHWRLDQLPIMPQQFIQQQWQYVEKPRQRAQLQVIQAGLQRAVRVVHAGDPDREGQALIDEVLMYLGNTLPVKRLPLHDLHPKHLRDAIRALDEDQDGAFDNHHFIAQTWSVIARQRADWLWGLNLTRAFTLLGRQAGHEGVLTVGRVQTPVLAQVVARDEAIEHFKAETYFELSARFRLQSELAFHQAPAVDEAVVARWQGHDAYGLIKAREFFAGLEKKITGSAAKVIAREEQHHVISPPLPLDLATLQIEAALRYGYSSSEVVEACQNLYEKHQVITWPRTDSRNLPESLRAHVDEVLAVLKQSFQLADAAFVALVNAADSWKQQACWKEQKNLVRHAIIPTAQPVVLARLSEVERAVYQLIVQFFLVQFYRDHCTTEVRIDIDVAGELFSWRAQQVTEPGWHRVMLPMEASLQQAAAPVVKQLLGWQVGDQLRCDLADVKERRTQAPLRFNEASLFQFMKHPDPASAAIALGTDSTRVAMLEMLLKRDYLMKVGRQLFSTPLGRDLVHALPPSACDLAMTLQWEKKLAGIAHLDAVAAEQAQQVFVQEVMTVVMRLIEEARHKKHFTLHSTDEILGLATSSKHVCPACQSLLVLRQGKHGAFWGCSRYPECKTTLRDKQNAQGEHEPDFIAHAGGAKRATARQAKPVLDKMCPECGKPLVRRERKQAAKGKTKEGVSRQAFAGCSGYPACRYTEPLLVDDLAEPWQD